MEAQHPLVMYFQVEVFEHSNFIEKLSCRRARRIEPYVEWGLSFNARSNIRYKFNLELEKSSAESVRFIEVC